MKVINDFFLTNPEGHMSRHILWKSLKCVVKRETIKYCALKKKRLIHQRLSLEAKLTTMESFLINCDPADKNAVLSGINTTKNNRDKLIEDNAKGAAVRSSARRTEYREKIPSIFLTWKNEIEKKNQLKVLKTHRAHCLLIKRTCLKTLNLFASPYLYPHQACHPYPTFT